MKWFTDASRVDLRDHILRLDTNPTIVHVSFSDQSRLDSVLAIEPQVGDLVLTHTGWRRVLSRRLTGAYYSSTPSRGSLHLQVEGAK